MAIAALAAAGLVGGGLVAASQFASADRPEIDSPSGNSPAAAGQDEPAPDDSAPDDSAPERDISGDEDSSDGDSIGEGKIVIQVGEGEPIVIDFGEFDFAGLQECIGLPAGGSIFGDAPFGDFDFESMFDDLPFDLADGFPGDSPGAFPLGELDFGSQVTVTGPDGVEFYDFGDSDGSITITQTDGEISVSSEGDVTTTSFEDLLAELPFDLDGIFDGHLDGFDPENFDPEQLNDLLDDFRPAFEQIDVDAINQCIDEYVGR